MATINIRDVPDSVANRFRQNAGARGLTQADYLTSLVELHENMRHIAQHHENEAVREEILAWLVTVNLQPVVR